MTTTTVSRPIYFGLWIYALIGTLLISGVAYIGTIIIFGINQPDPYKKGSEPYFGTPINSFFGVTAIAGLVFVSLFNFVAIAAVPTLYRLLSGKIKTK